MYSWGTRVSSGLRVCGAADEGRLVRRPAVYLFRVSTCCVLCAHILLWMFAMIPFFEQACAR